MDNNEETAFIVRVWETLGGRGTARLSSNLPVKSIQGVNLLEEVLDNPFQLNWENGQVSFPFKPFQILSFKIHLK